jgi:flagellar biosynthesis protein FlhF
MNVKRYRAATMRGALEQIKSELGDGALVLGSREIRSKGFLGLGGKNLVEVRVSTEFTGITPPVLSADKPNLPRKSTFTSLSLSDSSPATPKMSTSYDRSSGTMSSALSARANTNETKPPVRNKTINTNAVIKETRSARPEALATHATPAAPAPAVKTTTDLVESAPASSASQRDSLLVELERLRAEVREVKFSLSRPSHHNADRAEGALSLQNFRDTDAEIYDSPFYESYLHLASLGLAPEMCRAAVRTAIAAGNKSGDIHEIAHTGLVKTLSTFINFGELPSVGKDNANSVIALVGPTGVGKTTTVAKLAARAALREHKRVELITLDTYRIAAVEQLRTYAEIIGAGFHVPRSVLELDALIQRFSGDATILIDTIGRSARDLADQLELADYLRANEEIIKCLVIQATTHPTDALLAVNKFALFGADRLVITKLDETSRPGAAISTAAAAKLPLVYLCSGQRVPEDIENATPQSLTAHALQSKALAMAA